MEKGNLPYCVGEALWEDYDKGEMKEEKSHLLLCGCRDLERERERESGV